MTERVRAISNPLTIVAIFAALAEINATVSIGLVDKELQEIFIWFVIGFPTFLVALFFATLNFNTKVIYAPSDYKDDEGFHKMFTGFILPDKEINVDKNIIKNTLQELGIQSVKDSEFDISEDVYKLFSIRYSLEKELRRINTENTGVENPRPLMMFLPELKEMGIITDSEYKVIRNVYSITAPAVHGDDSKLTLAQINYVKEIAPGLIKELQKK